MDNQEPEIKEAPAVNPDIKETVNKQEQRKSQGHDSKPTVIIIKRVKKHIHKHHGGAWKIAYADFVTAMMTFFLLLWLLAMLNKYQLQGISDYFKNPTKSVIPTQPDDIKKDKVESKETKRTDVIATPKKESNPSDSKEDLDKKGRADSEKIKKDLEQQLKTNPKISQFANSLNFIVQSNGLKIELKDLENKTMFSSGKTDFDKYAKDIINWLGPAMNKYPNRIMIVGHTDNKPFGTDENYTNWELSADRANATRRELIKYGMVPDKIVRIVGTASVDKLETAIDDADPTNRRISIIVLTDDAYQKLLGE